jgi:DNA (cytosine-5)-methyltransferase 1
LTASAQQSLDAETETLIAVAHALRGEGFDASEDGTGRGTPLVAMAFDQAQITSKANRLRVSADLPTSTMSAHPDMCVAIQERAVSENPNAGPDGAGINAEGVACTPEARDTMQTVAFDSKVSQVQTDDSGAKPWVVRRLTPQEAERLMGFPDDFTLVPYRNKPAEACPDGPRYKAIGNSWAVNCAEWIGERINIVDKWP